MKNLNFILLFLILVSTSCTDDKVKPKELNTYALLNSVTSPAIEVVSLSEDREALTLKSSFLGTTTRVGELLYVFNYWNLEVINLAQMESINYKEYNSIPEDVDHLRQIAATTNHLIVAFQNFSSAVISLMVLDINTLEQKQIISLDLETEFYSMATSGNKVYISSPTGIYSIDVTEQNSARQVSDAFFNFPSFYAIDDDNLLVVTFDQLYKLASTNDKITEIGAFNNGFYNSNPQQSPVAYDNSNDKVYHIISLPQPSPYAYYLSEYDINSQESTALVESTYSEELEVYATGLRSLTFDKQINKIVFAGQSKVQVFNIDGSLSQEFDFSDRSVEVVTVF